MSLAKIQIGMVELRRSINLNYSSEKKMMRTKALCVCTLLGLFLSGWFNPSTAYADQEIRKKFKDQIHVVQPKPVLQKKRFELVTRFGMTINDSIQRRFKLGVNANFHIAEPFYVGGIFEWYDFGNALGGEADSYTELRNQTGAKADSPVLNYYAGLELGFVPLWGKFSLFNSSIVFYDVAVTAGGLYIDAKSLLLRTPKNTFGGTVSITGRIFLNKWIALNTEIRDVIYLADLKGADSSFANVVSFGLGFSFYLPTAFEYTEKVVDIQAQ